MHDQQQFKFGWSISLAFWLTLLCAAGMYGVVALSPKLLTHLVLRNQFFANQVRLVSLEREVNYLDRVLKAMESDPEFKQQLAHSSFDTKRNGSERIDVQASLKLDARLSEPAGSSAEVGLPWYGFLLTGFAENQSLRHTLLIVASVLTVMSFTFLHESQEQQLRSVVKTAKTGLGWIARRYSTPR